MQSESDLVGYTTRFCRVLRLRGLLVGPREIADAIRALGLVDVLDRGRVYWAFRSVLLSRKEEIPAFDELFERFWNFEPQQTARDVIPGMSQAGGMREFRRQPRVGMLPEEDPSSDNALVQVVRSDASPDHVVSETDLTVLGADELSQLSRIAARMVRALASRPGRRRKRHRRKGSPDLRGAFRLNLATGGDLIRLPRLRRVPRVPRLLVLLDVSGSMDRHARLLLQLVYAVAQRTKRVETFVFSTSLTRVTRELGAASFAEALERIGRAVDHWSGGTRIGDSIAEINAEHRATLDGHTTVLLLSDGWDTGEPEALAREMTRMRRRVRRIVWLNPLAGTEGYQPETRGLRAAMPHVDQFVPASNVDQLKRLPQLLRA